MPRNLISKSNASNTISARTSPAQYARPQSGQKERIIRLAWIWQARKAEKEGSHGLQSEDAAENQNFSQDRRQIPSRQGGKGRGSGAKEVDLVGSRIYIEKRLTTRPGRDHNSAGISS
jgi:hypothetical protein